MKKRIISLISAGVFLIVAIFVIKIIVSSQIPEKSCYNTKEAALLAGINENLDINNISSKNELFLNPLYQYNYKQDTYYVNRIDIQGQGSMHYCENVYILKVSQKDNKYYFETASPLFAIKQVLDNGETFTPIWTIPVNENDLNKRITFILGIVDDPQNNQVIADKKVTIDEDGFFVYVFKGNGNVPKVTIMNNKYIISQ